MTKAEIRALQKLKKDKTGCILRHMITHKSGITGAIAFTNYGVYRLSAVIYNLRTRYGIDIVTEMETKNGATYARYILGRYAA